MTTSTMKMPASYSAIEAEEMTYLDGGASNAYQSFLDIGKVFNYIARIFSASSSVLRQLLFNRFCRSIRSVNIRARLTVADTFWT